MDKDFTLETYGYLLKSALDAGYEGVPIMDFAETAENCLFLRQDVDKKPRNSVNVAAIQANLGCKGTYYFRAVQESLDEEAILRIAGMGHEIGYHYEDLATASGNMDKAWDSFQRNLEQFRKWYPVKTISMHGSPLSRWDNRKLWEKFDYKSLGITCEPYMDMDFREVFYLTDTGGRWNDSSVSRRDLVDQAFDIQVSSSFDLIEKFRNRELPGKIMQTIHPQRWTNDSVEWYREKITQEIKNVGKRLLK